MKTWLKRIRGAIGMGLTWAVGWALTGLAIGVASIALPFLPWHLFFDVFDAPLPALAVPGFFGGLFYWFPKMFGVKLNEGLGKLQFVIMFIG